MKTRTLSVTLFILSSMLCFAADGVMEFTNGIGTTPVVIPVANGARVTFNVDTNQTAAISLNSARQHAATNVHLADDIIVSNSVTASTFIGNANEMTGVVHPSELTSALAAKTNFSAMNITNRLAWPGSYYVEKVLWSGSGAPVLMFYDVEADGAAFWITNNALAADDARFSSLTLGGVTHTTWPSGGSGSTNQTTIGTNDTFQGVVSAVAVTAKEFNINGTGAGYFAIRGSDTNTTPITLDGSNGTVTATELSGSNLRRAFYVDSLNGSDSASGLSAASAWLTFAKLTNSLGDSTPDNITLHIARGSHFRQQFELGTNVVVDTYGRGSRPIIDGSEIATGWSLSSGKTSTWEIAWTPIGGGSGSRLTVWENNNSLIRTNSAASVETNPGTFYASDAPTAGAATTVYMHPIGNSTNGRTYEISKRMYAFKSGDFADVRGIHTKNAMINNGSCELGHGIYAREILAENGTVHNFLWRSGVIEDCIALKCEYWASEGDSTMFVCYSDTDGLASVARRCKAINKPYPFPASGYGFYSHTANGSGGFAFNLFEDCTAENVGMGFSGGVTATNGIVIYNRCAVIGSRGGWYSIGGTNYILDCEYRPSELGTNDNWQEFGRRLITTKGWTEINGLRASGYGNVSAVYVGNDNATVMLLNSVIQNESTGGSVVQCGYVTNTSFTVSNCILTGFNYPYFIESGTSNRLTSGGNVINNFSVSLANADYATTWGQWQGFGYDAGSLTNSVTFLFRPRAGDYRFSKTSPAVTNRAGPTYRLLSDLSRFGIESSAMRSDVGDFAGNSITTNFTALTAGFAQFDSIAVSNNAVIYSTDSGLKLRATGTQYGVSLFSGTTDSYAGPGVQAFGQGTGWPGLYLDSGTGSADIFLRYSGGNGIAAKVKADTGVFEVLTSISGNGSGLSNVYSPSSAGWTNVGSTNYTANRVEIGSGSNVVIGTNTPAALLHLQLSGSNQVFAITGITNATPSAPSTVVAWIPVTLNGTNGFIPFYK